MTIAARCWCLSLLLSLGSACLGCGSGRQTTDETVSESAGEEQPAAQPHSSNDAPDEQLRNPEQIE